MKKYQIIYADPPWRYDFAETKCRKIENKYDTMDLESIKKLQIPTDKNAILFLWGTAPKLREAFEVMDAWGFEYKTHCIWDKELLGMGYWFRSIHELLLVGVKGKMSPPDTDHRIASIYRERRTKHSKKPYFFRKLISEAYPEYNKLEMFSRKKNELFDESEGWDMWGNEVDSDIEFV